MVAVFERSACFGAKAFFPQLEEFIDFSTGHLTLTEQEVGSLELQTTVEGRPITRIITKQIRWRVFREPVPINVTDTT